MGETDRNQDVALSLRGKRPYLAKIKPTVGPDYLEGIQRAELAKTHLRKKELVKHKNPTQIGVVDPEIPSTSLRVNLCPGEVVLFIEDPKTEMVTVYLPYSQETIAERAAQGLDVVQTIRNVASSHIKPIGL